MIFIFPIRVRGGISTNHTYPAVKGWDIQVELMSLNANLLTSSSRQSTPRQEFPAPWSLNFGPSSMCNERWRNPLSWNYFHPLQGILAMKGGPVDFLLKGLWKFLENVWNVRRLVKSPKKLISKTARIFFFNYFHFNKCYEDLLHGFFVWNVK